MKPKITTRQRRSSGVRTGGKPKRQLAAAARLLRRARQLVISDPGILGGDPVFRGTRVPVHVIAALLADGGTETDLLASYPRLTREMLQLAPLYAAAYPLRDRPQTQPWRNQPPRRRLRRKIQPNAETIEAMQAARRGDVVTVGKPSQLIASLNEDC